MTIPKPRERVAVRYETTSRGYLELRVRSYDSKDPDIAELLASERVYVREDVASDEARLFRDQRNVLASKLATAEDEARLFRDQRNVLASKLATAEDEATALRRERDALRAWKDRAIDELRRCEAWFVKRGASYEEHASKAADEEIRTLWEQSACVNRESICKVDSMRGALCCKDADAAGEGVG